MKQIFFARIGIVVLGMTLLLNGVATDSAATAGEILTGPIERVTRKGFERFIHMDGQPLLINNDTKVIILRGKEIIDNASLGNLRVGMLVTVLVSDIDDIPWAKRVQVAQKGRQAPVRSGNMQVPVVRP